MNALCETDGRDDMEEDDDDESSRRIYLMYAQIYSD